jgi:hypothetical protein
LQNAKLLEKLYLCVIYYDWSFVGLHDILSPNARTLKVLDLTISLIIRPISLLPGGLCEELEAMAGHNMLEALSFEVHVDVRHSTSDFIGSITQKVENVLVKPGWFALVISLWENCTGITKSDERIYEYVLPCRKYKPGLGIYYRKTDLYLPCI